jgi:hypothetical protein
MPHVLINERFGPAVGQLDSWTDLSRWKRALGLQWYIKLLDLLLFLGS